jgi:sugar lactone lactonase YvrE
MPGSGGDTTADEVFGENGSFTATNFQSTNGESATTLLSPGGIALDGSGNLYVADEGNQRVLEYVSSALNPPGAASLVLGQCDSFDATGCPPPPNIQTGLEETLNFALPPAGGSNLAGGLAFDDAADLYVADTANNRVLALTSPLTSSTTQFSGRVLGQASFAHNSLNLIDGAGYSTPWGVALDPSVTPNRLYVVDSQNNRVLAYSNATSIDNLKPANAVFGQPDFVSYYPNQFDSTASNSPTAGTLAYPTAAVVDSSGNLFVADTGNSRVLVFQNPLSSGEPDGFAANLVIGQNGSFTTGQNGVFTSAGCASTPSATRLCVPNGLALDAAGNLYIVDAGYNRVLEFSTPASSPTLVKVFGQPDATTLNTCSIADPTAICAPDGGIAFDGSGHLYVDGAHAGTGIGIYNSPSTESSPDVVVPARAFAIALTSFGDMFLSQGDTFAAGSSTLVEYAPPFTNSSAPSQVFGPSFVSPQILALTFSYGLGFDSNQFLYMADSGNNRVLIFQHVAATASPTATASPHATKTPTPTATATATASKKATPSATPTRTATTGTPIRTATPTATPTAAGVISVSPKKLNLSASPSATASASITITNLGPGPLTVNVTVPKHSPPFTEIGGRTGIVVPPNGATYQVTIVYSPLTKGSTSDQIVLTSDDPKHKKPIKVKLKGKSK